LSKGASSAADLYLEDFALSGMEASIQAIMREEGWPELRERIRREAHAEGYAEAESEAAAAGRELAAGPVAGLRELLAELAAERGRFQAQNFEEILQLSLALAERVLRVELPENVPALRARLEACLRQLAGESAYTIKVHPARLEALSSLLEISGEELFGGLPYRLEGDRRVPPGSLVLEGDKTRLESICEHELQRLEDHLLELHRSGGAPDGD
jgi:flagellar assembly protein FliH